jgi:uncharacterized protein (TIGR02271 family)
MNSGTTAPDQLFGTQIVDSAGDEVGKVDGVWVEDATDELEFVGVKLGFLMGKTHVIPVANAQVSADNITVPYSKDQIKDAPSVGTDDELSPESEDEIYSYYGIDRSTSSSPTGLPSGEDTSAIDRRDTRDTDYGDATERDQSLTPHEEELRVGKREVEVGQVRLRKVVRTEHQEVPVELRREEIEIERVPATQDSTGGTAFQEQEIDIPVMRQEAVVGKESHATEQVRPNKTTETETETVGGEIRREDVDIDRDDETDLRRSTDTDSSTR